MFARALTGERAKQHGERDRKRLMSLRRCVARVRSAAGGDEIQQRHVSPTLSRAYLPLLLTVIIRAKHGPRPLAPCPLPSPSLSLPLPLSLSLSLSRSLLGILRVLPLSWRKVLLALVSPPFPPRVPGHSSLPRGLQSPFIPFSPYPLRPPAPPRPATPLSLSPARPTARPPPSPPLSLRAKMSSLSRVCMYLQFPRSPSEPGTSRQCPLSIRLSLPRIPPTGSTFPSSRYDSVSVSSIFPLSRCPERLNTNAFIVGTTTDVRSMTSSSAWAHPRAEERE